MPSLVATVVIACGSKTNDEPTNPVIPLPERDGGDDDGGADASGSDTSAPGSDANAGCDLSNALVGFWSFDENMGTTAVDKSLFKHDGTLVGPPAWSTDKPPTKEANTSSLVFNGTNTHVEIGNVQELRITGALSLCAWIKTSVAPENYRTVVSKWWSGGEDAAYSLYFANAGGIGLSVNSGIVTTRASSGFGLNDNLWHLVTGTWDGMTARIYVDGIERAAENAPPGFGLISDIDDPVRIGTDNRFPADQGDRYFNGSIDDVRIYKRALSPEEVAMLFNGTCKKL